MTTTTSPPRRRCGEDAAPRGLSRFLSRPERTTRQQLDDALAAIGAGAFATTALRIGDLLHPISTHLAHAVSGIAG